MTSSGAVQVKLELGHRAQVRKKPTVEGFTHDWMVFVRGPEHSNIQHFVEKVVFHLHESFPRPKRVCKDPPYKVEESGYAGFILPIEVYFKNKEEPKKVRFDYDLFLHLDGHPPVNHLRCEKLTFNKPTEEFCRKLLKAGGHRDPHKRSSEDSKVMVMQEAASSLFRQHLKLPALHSGSVTLTLSEAKKSKPSHGSKVTRDAQDGSRSALTTSTTSSSGNSSSSSLKPHKLAKEHRDRALKDSGEPKSAFKVLTRELCKPPKDSSRKPKENQPVRDDRPKTGFKEPKGVSKEHRPETGLSHGMGAGGPQHNGKASSRRPADTPDHATKRRKRDLSETAPRPTSNSPPRWQHPDRRLPKEGCQVQPAKRKTDTEPAERVKPTQLPPFQDLVDPDDSDTDDNVSAKYESEQPSPANSSCSSKSGFAPPHKRQARDPLRSIIRDLHSDDNEEDESEEDDDSEAHSDLERPLHSHLTHRHRRVSLSDGSHSEKSSASSPSLWNDPPTLLKASNNQVLEGKSPVKPGKLEKITRSADCDKAYLDELVELHRRLMALRERHILQQIVNLIEETGHFHLTNTTFDFDLCSLDRTTVRKLQSYLETSGTS
ncbi:protein AF-9-like [Megalops cyprinoides]|uniref:protein AF-9-like n=1 Tax=Megalops cyprinoides TaxID=118141 RepID=UPI001864BACF|nr:protein AF-9-like [Megalops cyprinoides]